MPGLALAIGMVLMPSSPRWLVEQGRDEEAREMPETKGRSLEEIETELGASGRVDGRRAHGQPEHG